MVKWKDLTSGMWQPRAPVLARVRGAVCVYPTGADKPMWVPEWCVHPVQTLSKKPENGSEASALEHPDVSKLYE